jgi:hypothetical protein
MPAIIAAVQTFANGRDRALLNRLTMAKPAQTVEFIDIPFGRNKFSSPNVRK